MFDYTQGWSGTLTNAYGIREAGYTEVSGDPRGIEGDGNLDGLTPGLTPQSNPTITNMTIVNNAAVSMADMIKVRRSSSGTFTNILVTQGAGALAPGDFVDCTDGAGEQPLQLQSPFLALGQILIRMTIRLALTMLRSMLLPQPALLTLQLCLRGRVIATSKLKLSNNKKAIQRMAFLTH